MLGKIWVCTGTYHVHTFILILSYEVNMEPSRDICIYLVLKISMVAVVSNSKWQRTVVFLNILRWWLCAYMDDMFELTCEVCAFEISTTIRKLYLIQ